MHNTSELFFENTMRLFFGDEADNCAGQERVEKHRRKWLEKTAKVITRQVCKVDSTTQHLQILSADVEAFGNALNEPTINPWHIVYTLLRLCGALLGYVDYKKGSVLYELMYYQTSEQRFSDDILQGRDTLQCEKKDAISVKKRLVKQLGDEGLADFKISLVLNISEREIKKLKRSL